MTEYTDQEIIECLKNRKGYVVHYLSDRYLPMIRLLVYQFGGTGEDAKDLFQDALLIMLQKIDTNELVLTCKFKTFLYSVCENLWKKVLEKRHAASNYLTHRLDDSVSQDFSEIYDNKIYEHMFYDMFETMGPVCKQILNLYWQEFTPREIADKLGYNYGYIRRKKCECEAELIEKVYNHPEYIEIKKLSDATKYVVYE